MGLRTTVIVNEINNLSDARYCAGMGVDYLGFSLESADPGYVDPEKFKEITSWVSGPEYLGEFKNSSPEIIKEISSVYSINSIYLSNYKLVKDISRLNFNVFLELSSSDQLNSEFLSDLKDYVKYFVWTPGISDPNIHATVKELASDFPIILGGDFNPDYLNGIENLPFQGIALKGGDEVKPGYREFDEMADILEILEEDF